MKKRNDWTKNDYIKEINRVDYIIGRTERYFCKLDHLKYRNKLIKEMKDKGMK